MYMCLRTDLDVNCHMVGVRRPAPPGLIKFKIVLGMQGISDDQQTNHHRRLLNVQYGDKERA